MIIILKRLAVILFIFISLTVSGCDTSVDPLQEVNNSYSIYGHLEVGSNSNIVRVRNVNNPINKDSTRTLNVDVKLHNLDNGTTEILKDSLIQFEGVYSHNFISSMKILSGTSYQVDIHTPNDNILSATATTPEITNFNVSPTNEDCETFITLSFSPVKAPRYLDLYITFFYDGDQFRLPIASSPSSSEGNVVSAGFTPQGLLDRYFKDDPTQGRSPVQCYELDSDEFLVEYTHYGPDFFQDTPSDSLDAPVRIGQFGGLYENTASFRIDTTRLCRPYC